MDTILECTIDYILYSVYGYISEITFDKYSLFFPLKLNS